MKKLLSVLTLFSIMPLCAMKQKPLHKKKPKKEHELYRQARDTTLQQILDKKLYDELFRSFFEPGYKGDITPLLQSGANPNASSEYQPCLFLAVQPSAIHALFKHGANILQKNSTQATVFHSIAVNGPAERLALFLLYAQAKKLELNTILSMQNTLGQTPRSIAAQRGTPFFTIDDFDAETDDKEKMLLIMADPYNAIQDLCPEVVEDFQRAQIARRIEQTSAHSLHQYLLNREIGGKR